MRKHKNLNALFQIDSLSQLNPETDSSLDIIKEGLKIGLNKLVLYRGPSRPIAKILI